MPIMLGNMDIKAYRNKRFPNLPVEVAERVHQLGYRIRLARIRRRQSIADLAIRHRDYGTKPKHYASVGQALLWTLEKGLGYDWNEEVAEAWLTCYTLLSNTMIDAANETPQYFNEK